jgi:hypothetical protein
MFCFVSSACASLSPARDEITAAHQYQTELCGFGHGAELDSSFSSAASTSSGKLLLGATWNAFHVEPTSFFCTSLLGRGLLMHTRPRVVSNKESNNTVTYTSCGGGYFITNAVRPNDRVGMLRWHSFGDHSLLGCADCTRRHLGCESERINRLLILIGAGRHVGEHQTFAWKIVRKF